MAAILVLYGTTHGQTAKVAEFLARELRSLGDSVDVVEARQADPDPARYDAVIVAASIYAGRFQRSVAGWVRRHARSLRGRPAAFLAVCLGVLQQDLAVQRELVGIINRFEARTGWKAQRVKLVAGALAYTQYNWLTRMLIRRMAGKAGGSTDVSRDHEYTDWADLRDFAEAFHPAAPVRAASPASRVEARPEATLV